MIQPRWAKVWRDLWHNKVRSLLVIASITIGVLVVGLGVALVTLVDEHLTAGYESTHPSHAWVYCSPATLDVPDSIRRLPGIEAAEGVWTFSTQLQTGSDQSIPLQITAMPSLDQRSLDYLASDSGDWPPEDRTLYLERGSLAKSGFQVGDPVQVRLSDDTVREMIVGGVLYEDMADMGSDLVIYGYVTMDSLEWMHQPNMISRVHVRVTGDTLDKAHIEDTMEVVKEHLVKNGQTVYYVYVPEPGKRPDTDSILGVIKILTFLGFLAVVLGGFLIYSTLSAMLNQHVKHIGVMKAIGARTGQITGMYIVLILVYGFVSLLIAVPLAAQGAHRVAVMLGQQFHFNSLPFRMVPQAIALQFVLGLGVPLVAGLLPVRNGTRITIREALSDYGLNASLGHGLIDRILGRIQNISRPLLISLRNTFRHKGRLAMTLITLTLGGAIFISVFALRASMVDFIGQFGKYFLANVNVDMTRYYRIDEVRNYAMAVPGVESVEGWMMTAGDLLDTEGDAIRSIQIMAPPADSELVEPVLLRGRWIVPGDDNAIVVNGAFWKIWPDLDVGDEINLHVEDKDTVWQIVGFFQFPGEQLLGYATYDYVSRLVGAPHRSAMFRIVGDCESPDSERQLAKRVETVLKDNGFDVGNVQTGRSLLDANAQMINSIVGFFLGMAAVIACVGGIGLMGTMSMNVLERTREVGVMRAVGARDGTILGIIVVEGMFIGLLSWCFAGLMAVPISRLLVRVMWRALFQADAVKVVPSSTGVLVWLVLVLGLSALSSYMPAHSASRLTVRETLSYQ